MAKRIGIYPGTFDPITLGHMDIIERGAKLVDELIIGVTTNIAKSPMFDDDERIAMVEHGGFSDIGRHPDDQLVDQLGAPFDDVHVPQRDGVECSGINADTFGHQ